MVGVISASAKSTSEMRSMPGRNTKDDNVTHDIAPVTTSTKYYANCYDDACVRCDHKMERRRFARNTRF